MTVRCAANYRVGDAQSDFLRLVLAERPMIKKYEIVSDRIPLTSGGFVQAFRMALVDLACFGEKHLDVTGYPHETEQQALSSDWTALGADFRSAYNQVSAELGTQRGDDDRCSGKVAAE